MALYIEGETALVARLTTEFSVSETHARTAMNAAWMGLACGEETLDVPGLVFEQFGDHLQVYENDQMICTLDFEPGVLPRKVVPFADLTPVDDGDDGWEAFDRFMEEQSRWLPPLRSAA